MAHGLHRLFPRSAGRNHALRDAAMNRPLISVIVPVRNDPDGIRSLLTRLRDQTIPRDRFEVVIGDDGSRPECAPRLDDSDVNVRVVKGPPKTSYAARNRAVAAARGAVLAFTDADCLPEPTWLERGLAALDTADVIAGEVRYKLPPRPTVWSLLTVDMFLDQERAVRFSGAVTANLFVRRQLFDALGGFDEELPSGGDADFAHRVVAGRGRLIYGPDAVVLHPTIDRARQFLRKVWRVNRWTVTRRVRSHKRTTLAGYFAFVPFIGVACSRRRALRPALGLELQRLRACGARARLRDRIYAMTMLYFVVSYVAGFAKLLGWVTEKVNKRRNQV
jgi:glycosyltransferase involved in cell wall biosynthesis